MNTKTKTSKPTRTRARSPAQRTGPFFQKKSEAKSAAPFFRPALQQQVVTGRPGDAYENEADSMADAVTGRGPLADSHATGLYAHISPRVQRQADDEKEDVQAKMKDEKEEQVQAQVEEEVQAQAEEEDVQAQADKEEEEVQAQAEEQDEEVQAQAEEEEEVQAQAEDEEKEQVQAQAEEEDVQAQADQEEEVQTKTDEDEAVQARAEGSVMPASQGFVRRQLRARRGMGSRLPDGVRNKMETSFAADFSGIRIHADDPAVQLTRLLKAKAFTHGRDLYFNSGRFAPQTRDGEHLLAHELTHTIQQGVAGEKDVQLDAEPTTIQRKDDDESTILIRPELLDAIKIARGEIGGVNAKKTNPDGSRQGWERLYEYFFTAFGNKEVVGENVIKKIVQYKGKDAMPSWCGIFVWWAYKKAGIPVFDWKLGGPVLDFAEPRKPGELPRKGDIAYKGLPYHHFALVSGVEAAEGKDSKSIQVATVNGNTAGEDVLGGQIQEKWEPISKWVAFYDPVANLDLPDVPLVKTSVEPDEYTADEDTAAEPPQEVVNAEPTDVSDLEEKEISTPAQLPAAGEADVGVELPAPPAPPVMEKVAEVQQLGLKGSSDQAMVSFTEASPSQMAKTQPALGGKLDEKIKVEQKDEVENAPVLVAKTSGTVEEGITSPDQIPVPGDAQIGDGVSGSEPGQLVAQPHQNKGDTPNNNENDRLLDKQEEGGFLDWLRNTFMRKIRTTDPGLNTSAGDRPNVKLEGEAAPGRIDQQRGDADSQLKTQRDATTSTFKNHPGQTNIQPKEVNEEKPTKLSTEATVTIETPADPGVADYAAAPLPADVRGKADALLKPGLDTNLGPAKSQTQQAATKKEGDKKAAVAKAESDAAKINSKADKDQRDIVIANRKDVATKQTAAIEEAYGQVNEFNKQADGKQTTARKEIGDKVKDSEGKAKTELEQGEKDAENKKKEGEREAKAKKKELEKNQKKSSWWDRAVNLVKKAVSRC